MSFLSSQDTDIAQPMELSLFASPPNQVAVEKVYFADARPISSITSDDTPIEIVVSGSGAEYLDLKRSQLYVKAKIVEADGTDLVDKEKTGIINLPLQSMFSQIEIYLNNKLVSLNSNNYPWKAYIKTILSSGGDEQSSQLQSQLFFKDEDSLDDPDADGGANVGLLRRTSFTQKPYAFEMEANLQEDIFGIEKFLIHGVDLYLKLFRSSNPFLFMSKEATPNYKLKLLDVVYKAAKVKVDPAVLFNHAKQIQTSPARYVMTRTDVKMNTIPKDSSEFYWDNMFPQCVPDTLVFGLVSQKACNGSYEKNPFDFQHYKTTSVGLYVNGESVPGRPLALDFGDKRNYIPAYVRLFEACHKWNTDSGLKITLSEYGNGFTFFVFVLKPNDFGDEEYINLVRRGNTRLEIKFETPLTEAVNVIAYSEVPSILEIDHTRQIHYVQP